MRYVIWLLLALATAVDAQRQQWQIGGAARVWSDSDSLQVLIDYHAAPGAIQPVYIDSSRSMLTLFAGWQPLKEPRELFYIEGETPRAWKGANGNVTTAHNGTYMVDGDSLTFNPPVSSNPESVWYTIDLAVPVPAHRFGFFTPPRGYRSDGTPFALDAVPAYEVSIAAEGDPAWLEGTQPYQRIGPVIADVPENFAANVRIEFPRQYVRFVRYKRKTSLLDSAEGSTNSVRSGTAFRGSIGDFELFGAGAPRKAIYRSQIFDLGMSVNFGRLRWAATPLRRVGDQWVEAPDAEVGVEVEVRTGRDGDPNVYHEYTDRGGEQVVSREHYDLVLQPRWRAGLLREPRPGMRASIIYDSENWSFWSLPFTQSGQTIDLRGGTHLQLRIVLKSEEFDALVRLDSLWIETAPLLASRVVGEEELSVVLPERIEPGGAEGARVVFATDVFALAWTFAGEVYDDGTDVLPQPIEPADVSAALGTNGLRVLGMAADREGPVAQLAFSTGVLTPNGDGIHDEVEISYALVGFPEAVRVALHVYALDGRRVAARDLGHQRFGAQIGRWDGRAVVACAGGGLLRWPRGCCPYCWRSRSARQGPTNCALTARRRGRRGKCPTIWCRSAPTARCG